MDKFIDKVFAPLLAFVAIAVASLISLGLSLLLTGWIWLGVRSVWSMILF